MPPNTCTLEQALPRARGRLPHTGSARDLETGTNAGRGGS